MAIVICVLLAVNGKVLVGRGQERRDNQKAATLGQRLVERSQKLQGLQDSSNEYRDAIGKALDAVDSVSNSLRAVGGDQIANAQATFPSVPPLFDEARKANVRLPKVTQQIIDETRTGRVETRLLLELVESSQDTRYLKAFDGALALLVSTHEAYSKMNAKIAETFTLYEALFATEDKFLTEIAEGAHKNRKEASKIFRDRTLAEVKALAVARAEIDSLDNTASKIAGEAFEAFERAARLRPKQ
ncbi:MAG: hypothetical protein ABIS18_08650 [Actinomycetota bacterium]